MTSATEIIRMACRNGLDSVTVELSLGGRDVPVSARHFDALHGAPVSDEERACVEAARAISSLDRPRRVRVQQQARDGAEWAVRAYSALVVASLAALRREARGVAERAGAGDARARAAVDRLVAVARGRVPADRRKRQRAQILACLLCELAGIGGATPAPEERHDESGEPDLSQVEGFAASGDDTGGSGVSARVIPEPACPCTCEGETC